MDWMNLTLFTLGGAPVLLIDVLTSVLGLTCVFLAGRNSKYNFWVGYLYTAALFVMFWNKNLYASLLLQPISLVINLMGHYRWTHPHEQERSSKDEKALAVSRLTAVQRVFAVVAVLVIAGAWGWLLVNITQIALHISVGHVFMPIVCGLYLANGLWSLISWNKLYKNKA